MSTLCTTDPSAAALASISVTVRRIRMPKQADSAGSAAELVIAGFWIPPSPLHKREGEIEG
jgi:hypothetical protein